MKSDVGKLEALARKYDRLTITYDGAKLIPWSITDDDVINIQTETLRELLDYAYNRFVAEFKGSQRVKKTRWERKQDAELEELRREESSP